MSDRKPKKKEERNREIEKLRKRNKEKEREGEREKERKREEREWRDVCYWKGKTVTKTTTTRYLFVYQRGERGAIMFL